MVTWDKAGERRAGIDTVQKSKKKSFQSDGYVHRLNHVDDFMGTYISQNLTSCSL